jgi:hypothetical protein
MLALSRAWSDTLTLAYQPTYSPRPPPRPCGHHHSGLAGTWLVSLVFCMGLPCGQRHRPPWGPYTTENLCGNYGQWLLVWRVPMCTGAECDRSMNCGHVRSLKSTYMPWWLRPALHPVCGFGVFGLASLCVALLCGVYVRLHLVVFPAVGPFLPSLSVKLNLYAIQSTASRTSRSVDGTVARSTLPSALLPARLHGLLQCRCCYMVC